MLQGATFRGELQGGEGRCVDGEICECSYLQGNWRQRPSSGGGGRDAVVETCWRHPAPPWVFHPYLDPCILSLKSHCIACLPPVPLLSRSCPAPVQAVCEVYCTQPEASCPPHVLFSLVLCKLVDPQPTVSGGNERGMQGL